MKIIIVGAGYVGLTTAACLANLGHTVACVDVNQERITSLRAGVVPIHEEGLPAIVDKTTSLKKLLFFSELEAVPFVAQAVFIAVGTPMQENGSADLQYVEQASQDVAKIIQDFTVVINKSTVPVGTADKVKQIIQNSQPEAKSFEVVSNPEFLKQGNAVHDFFHPDRVVVGVASDQAKALMRAIYKPLKLTAEQYLEVGVRDAEMIKYVANAFLATKISFMNEVANICESLNSDVEKVKEGVGLDSRIGQSFLNPGCGYGGSCFPKDVRALLHMATEEQFDAQLLKAVDNRNHQQKRLLAKKLIRFFKGNLSNKLIGLWGLAFKPGTDDMREATSIIFLQEVIEQGAIVKAYDPVAYKTAKRVLPEVWFNTGKLVLEETPLRAAEEVDALVVVTEWPELAEQDLSQVKKSMKGHYLLDGRNLFDPTDVLNHGISYEGIGRNLQLKEEEIEHAGS